MPNPDDNHQPLNQAEGSGYQEPSWVKPVKAASVIMGVLIVFCLALLGYGLSTNMGKLAEGDDTKRVFTHPAGMNLQHSSMTSEGALNLQFKRQDGGQVIITLNPQRQKIISHVEVKPGADFGFADQ